MDPNCFNEEAGEISLSVLARMTAGTDRRDIDIMQQRYRLTKPSLVVAHHMKSASRERSLIPSRVKKYEIDVEGLEVATTLNYFQEIIRKCKANQHQIVQIPATTKVVKRSADFIALLVRASHLPKRMWWDASHDSQIEAAFDAQVKHVRERWLDEEYCQFAKPWFAPSFVDRVRRAKAQGGNWEQLFNVVPDAKTSSDDSGSDEEKEMEDENSEESSNDDDDDDSSIMTGDVQSEEEENENLEADGHGSSDEGNHATEMKNPSSHVGSDGGQGRPPPRGRSAVDSKRVKRHRGTGHQRRASTFSMTDDDPESDADDEGASQGRSNRFGNETRALARNRKRRRQEEIGFYHLINKFGNQG